MIHHLVIPSDIKMDQARDVETKFHNLAHDLDLRDLSYIHDKSSGY